MRIEQRNIYIAEDATEFDSEDACIRHDKIQYLTSVLSSAAYVDGYYVEPIAIQLVDNFDRIKEIVEG